MRYCHSRTVDHRSAGGRLRCLGPLLASVLIIGGIAIGAAADVVQITPSHDASVQDSLPNSNFGASSLYVGDAQPEYPNSISRSYLKFDLSTLPTTAVVDSAMIYIYNNVIDYPAVSVGAHFLSNDNWSEATITWNNAPTGFNATATALKTISMCVWTSWTVTPDVQTEWAGDKVYSVVMKEPEADEAAGENCVIFNSKEDPQPTDRPYLKVYYRIVTAAEKTTWGSIRALFR